MSTLISDLRYAIRSLLKSPGLTTAAVLSLGLGIGANTTIFSWVQAVLLRPIPGAADPSALVIAAMENREGRSRSWSYPNYKDLHDRSTLVEYVGQDDMTLSIAVDATAERAWGGLVRQLLTESLALAAVAGALGVAMAYWTMDVIMAFVPPIDIPIDLGLRMDQTTLLFALAISAATGVLFGLAPALQASRPETIHALKEEGNRGSGGRTGRRLRNTLVVAQVAVCLVLLLAAVGLYGVISYAVSQRTQEMGIRLALGASPGSLLGMIVGQGMKVTAIGLVIGLGLALAAFGSIGAMRALLPGISPLDPFTFVAVPVMLAAIALVASWIPARQAGRIDPQVALRVE